MNKFKVFLIFLCLNYSLVEAQNLTERKFRKIDKKIDAQKFNEVSLDKNSKRIKKGNCLSYNCNGSSKISLCDNNTDEDYVEFSELGVIHNSNIIAVQKITYNQEFYVFIDQKNCNQITLNGFPLRIENSNQYVVYNNPSTDERFSIQIINIINGIITIQDEIILPEYIRPKRLLRIDDSLAFILDTNNQIWETNIIKAL